MPDWKLYVDWNNDYDFSDADEDVTDYCVGTLKWQLGMRAFQHIADEGTLTATLENGDRRFSPEYTSGPLYGNLRPGLRVKLMYGSTIMWAGFTVDFKPAPLRYGRRTAVMECRGFKHILDAFEPFLDLYEQVTADEVLEDILTSLAWPPFTGTTQVWALGVSGHGELGQETYLVDYDDLAVVDTGYFTFDYVGDNLQTPSGGTSAYQVIKQMMETERGHFWIARDGKAVFRNRHYFITDNSVDVTLDNTAADIDYATPQDDLINWVEVTFYPRIEGADNTDALWQLNSPVAVPPGNTQSWYANYADDSGQALGGKHLQRPGGGDVTMQKGALNFDIQGAGQRALVTATNPGTDTAILEDYTLRGQSVSAMQPMSIVVSDPDSVALYGKRVLTLNLKLLTDIDEARSIANWELVKRDSLAGRAKKVELARVISAESDTQIAYGIGDFLRLIDYQLDHDRRYHIFREKHVLELTGGDKHLTTVWELEPEADNEIWQVGVTGFSELGQTTYLAG